MSKKTEFLRTEIGSYSIILLLAFVLVCVFSIVPRMRIENNYKTYEVIMELSDIKNMAAVQDKDTKTVIDEFMGVGISGIVIYENSIDSLKINEKFKISTSYEGQDLVVKGTKEGLAYIKNGIEQVIKDDRKIYYRDEDTLVIEGKLSDFVYNSSQIMRDFTAKRIAVENSKMSLIEYLGLGYDEEELKELSNYPLILRPVYYSQVQDGKKSIDRYIETVQKFAPKQEMMIGGSEELLGGESNIEYLKEKLTQANLVPVAIETSFQDGNIDTKGLLALVSSMGYRSTRLFSTLSYIQDRYDYGIPGHHQGQEIMNTYYRAITERNIRVIYFRPFHYKEGALITDMGIYKARLDELASRLNKYYGIKPKQENQPMQYLQDLQSKKGLMALIGLMAAIGILICYFIKQRLLRKFLLGLIVLPILFFIMKEDTSQNKIWALLTTIIYPTLSIVYLLHRIKQYEKDKSLAKLSFMQLFVKSIINLTMCIAISVIGGVFVAALYGESVYLLEFNKFSGVKISQMLPLLITALAYISIIGLGQYFDQNSSLITQLREAAQKNIKIWQALIAFAMIGVLALMILRSGHSSNVDPPMSELFLRNILEFITPARPRNKAIFLGFPALMIFVILAGKKMFKTSYILFAIAATIGQANILNTFSHIRTPFMMSVYRTIGEYVISIVLTFIIVVIATVIENFIKRKKK